MQMTSACQNAAHAAQSALLAQADHVAISCPENPRSFFFLPNLFIYSGELSGHPDRTLQENM